MEARLAAFKKDKPQGWGTPLSTIANLEVTVHGYSTFEGKFGTVYVMDVELPSGDRVNVYTSATVVARALENALDTGAFPVKAKFVRKARYWDIE